MKQILITGSTGGLGRAAAEYLVECGCRLFACDITESENIPHCDRKDAAHALEHERQPAT